ncbi:MAG: SocA family protein [Candidatus Riflebacteria bacterium]|nr:SocA family protein [Candidatus Riflebacteria bacterium]
MARISFPKMPKFSEEKATEVACFLLQLRGGEMSYMKLLKLMYLAERDFFIRNSSFIAYDTPVSMDRGPVLSRVYNLITEQPAPKTESFWRKFVSTPTQDYTVKLLGDVPASTLSVAEKNTIRAIFDKYGRMNRWDLVELSHTLPEWENPMGSSIPISIEEILRSAGKDKERIDSIMELNAHMAWVEENLT